VPSSRNNIVELNKQSIILESFLLTNIRICVGLLEKTEKKSRQYNTEIKTTIRDSKSYYWKNELVTRKDKD
jgi:hypothetical protein